MCTTVFDQKAVHDFFDKYVQLVNYEDKDMPWRTVVKLKQSIEKSQGVSGANVVPMQNVLDSCYHQYSFIELIYYTICVQPRNVLVDLFAISLTKFIHIASAICKNLADHQVLCPIVNFCAPATIFAPVEANIYTMIASCLQNNEHAMGLVLTPVLLLV